MHVYFIVTCNKREFITNLHFLLVVNRSTNIKHLIGLLWHVKQRFTTVNRREMVRLVGKLQRVRDIMSGAYEKIDHVVRYLHYLSVITGAVYIKRSYYI